jgi:hypothetical protein
LGFLRVFHHQYRVRSRWKRRARHDLNGFSCANRRISRGPRLACADLANHQQRRIGMQVLRPNRVPISRDSWERRLVTVRNQRDCQSSPERIDKIAVCGCADTRS